MSPAPGGFLTALGQAFGGYAQDEEDRLKRQRQTTLDAQRGMMHTAQMRNIDSEIKARDAKPVTQLQYDADRGGYVSPDGAFTPIANLPPKTTTPHALPWVAAGFENSPQGRKDYLRSLQDEANAKHVPTEQKDHFSFITTTGPNGEQIVSRANTSTGEIEPTDTHAKSGGQQSATGQLQQGRMLAAISEARLADERMRTFEDDLISGKNKIGMLQQAGGTLMTNLAGSHTVPGALGQAGSELGLNATNPEYVQYLRDAMTIGRAEQMISPRGGNETMVRANSLLARAGTGASKATIEASRMARQALFGHAGGLEQSLTRPQSEKINQGIQRIKTGETTAAPTTAQGKTFTFGGVTYQVP